MDQFHTRLRSLFVVFLQGLNKVIYQLLSDKEQVASNIKWSFNAGGQYSRFDCTVQFWPFILPKDKVGAFQPICILLWFEDTSHVICLPMLSSDLTQEYRG